MEVMSQGLEHRHGGIPQKDLIETNSEDYKTQTSPRHVGDIISETMARIENARVQENMWKQILNNDQILNSVLSQLQQNRKNNALGKNEESQAAAREETNDDTSYRGPSITYSENAPEFNTFPEYTAPLPENWERGLRQIGVQRHFSICHIERNIVSLNNDEFEYRPAHYEEIRCTKSEYEQASRNDICSSLGFSCVQWNKTIHLTRRRYSSGCWETNTRIIPAGCECMWPVHKLGDIKMHV